MAFGALVDHVDLWRLGDPAAVVFAVGGPPEEPALRLGLRRDDLWTRKRSPGMDDDSVAAERADWDFVPCVRVGPLRFGMTPEEVRAALVDAVPRPSTHPWRLEFENPGLSTYFEEDLGLCAVALDAKRGPQVRIADFPVVGRPPSMVADLLVDYAVRNDMEGRITHEGDPAIEALGLVLRAQRSGDVLRTRPIFVRREWAPNAGDVVSGKLPKWEWYRRSYAADVGL
ncbi:hypothetical protein [Embleya hyalina]|uniref:hypothetical protein n=1 Tax=Embleya hyalina TaxID=516124 RepID=UPI00135CB81E|nr:hypothetical protein [Embleya hyalina]